MTTRHLTTWIPAALLSLTSGLLAGPKADMTGTWKMDPAKCSFSGPAPAPDSRLDRVTFDGPHMKDTITQSLRGRESTYDMNYSTDGAETTNTVRRTTVKSTARWEGGDLVIDTKGSIMGRPITFKDRWSVSPDSKTLTIRRHLSNPMGESDQTLLFDRQ
jgi:hypothetical protein